MLETFTRRPEINQAMNSQRVLDPNVYVTIRTFPDPTAQEAVKRVGYMTLAMTRTREITSLSEQIAQLKQDKRDGKIDRRTFWELRKPIRDRIRALNRQRGGVI